MPNKVYFISGHRDITKEEFHKHYKHRILNAIRDGADFVVGDCPGVDFLALELLVKYNANNVTIYHLGQFPMTDGEDIILPEHFKTERQFDTDFERDIHMTYYSDEDILWIRDGKTHSGTHRNQLRREWLKELNDNNVEITESTLKLKEVDETLENVELF